MASQYVDVDGPVDPLASMVEYDVPFAPDDAKKTLKLRQKLGYGPETRTVDPNVRVVIDSFITPRRWVEGGTVWVQHASPFPAARINAVRTRHRLVERLAEQEGIKDVGVCSRRSDTYGECFLEVIRQVTAECWERGLLLLKVYSECLEAQRAHRELFESRTGYAMRLALKGDKDTEALKERLASLKRRAAELAEEEAYYKERNATFAQESSDQELVDRKKWGEEINALKKESNTKKNLLEALTAPIPKNTI